MTLYGSDAVNHNYSATKNYKLRIENGKCTLSQISSTTSGTDKLYTVVTPYSVYISASVV